MTIANSDFSSSSNFPTKQFYTWGTLPLTFSNGSMLMFRKCTMSAGSGGYPVYMNNAVTFSNSSFLALSSCTLTGGGDAFSIRGSVTFTNASFMTISSCNMTGGGYAFYMNSPATFTSSSYLALSSCNLTTGYGGYTLYVYTATFTIASYLALSSCTLGGGGVFGFFLYSATFTNSSYLALSLCALSGAFSSSYVGLLTVDGWSYVVVTNTSFTGTGFSSYPPVYSPLVIGSSSWVLWKGNRMNSVPGHTSCIDGSITFRTASVTGTVSILDKRCTCVTSCSLWAASPVAGGDGGHITQRCNTVNGASPTAAQLPTGTISVGPCGSCNASADCFGPLTFSNSTCSINVSSTGPYVVCQCLDGGVASNMCVPSSLFSPSSLATARGRRTATVSPSSELPSGALTTSASRTVDRRSDSFAGTSASGSYSSFSVSGSRSSSVSASISRTLELAGKSTFFDSTSGGTLSLTRTENTHARSLESSRSTSHLIAVISRQKDLGSAASSVTTSLSAHNVPTPLRTTAALKSAMYTTYRTSTVISSLLGKPVTALSNTGMAALLTLEECAFSDIDPLDAAVSPIPLAVGEEVGQYYRGGVVIAIAINIGYITLALLCAAVAPKLIRSKTPGDVLGLLKYPSSIIIFVGMFHEGMVSSSVSLLGVARNALDLLLGCCGLAAATTVTVFIFLAGTRWMQCHVAERSEDETHSSVKVVQLFLDLALWKQHWVDDVRDDGAPSGYKRRYFLILDDIAVGYWTAAELMCGLVQGAILGVRKNDLRVCQAQSILLLLLCFLMAVATLIARPCGSIFGNVFLFASKLGSFVVSLLIVIHTVSGSEAAQEDAELATAGFAFISAVQTVIQLLLALVLSRKTLLMFFRSLLSRHVASRSYSTVDETVSLEKMMLPVVTEMESCRTRPEPDLCMLLEDQDGQRTAAAADLSTTSAVIDVDPIHEDDDGSPSIDSCDIARRREEVLKLLQPGYNWFAENK